MTFPADTTGYSLIIKCDYTAFTTATINTSHDYDLFDYYRSAGSAVNTPQTKLTGQIIQWTIKDDDTEPRAVV